MASIEGTADSDQGKETRYEASRPLPYWNEPSRLRTAECSRIACLVLLQRGSGSSHSGAWRGHCLTPALPGKVEVGVGWLRRRGQLDGDGEGQVRVEHVPHVSLAQGPRVRPCLMSVRPLGSDQYKASSVVQRQGKARQSRHFHT